MTRVISSPSSSTTGLFALIFAMVGGTPLGSHLAVRAYWKPRRTYERGDPPARAQLRVTSSRLTAQRDRSNPSPALPAVGLSCANSSYGGIGPVTSRLVS